MYKKKPTGHGSEPELSHQDRLKARFKDCISARCRDPRKVH